MFRTGVWILSGVMGDTGRAGTNLRSDDGDGRVRFELLIITASDAPLPCSRWTRLAAHPALPRRDARRCDPGFFVGAARTRETRILPAIFTIRFMAPIFSLPHSLLAIFIFPLGRFYLSRKWKRHAFPPSLSSLCVETASNDVWNLPRFAYNVSWRM